MKATSFQQKLSLILFGLVCFILILELAMRLIGGFLTYRQERANRMSLQKKDSYRILFLGESTTALGGEQSYPRQVEKILKGKLPQKTFSIINKGKAATRAQLIVEEIPRYIEEYRPDMVVVMMGINDMIYGKVDVMKKNTPPFKKAMESMRTVKLFRAISESLLSRPKPDAAQTEEERDYPLKQEVEIDSHLRSAFEKSAVSILYAEDNMLIDHWEKAKQYYWDAIIQYPTFISHYMCLVNRLVERGEFDKSEDIYKYAIENNPNVIWGYTGLARLYQSQGREDLAKVYEEKAKSIERQYYDSIVKESYRQLKKLLDKNNIPLVCVQYPLRDIRSLKGMFDDPSGIIFVDNNNLFKEAIAREGYDTYFTDNFAGDFGHCSPKGNRLLAESVAGHILKYVQSN